jgi:hypothetical protein
MARGFAPNQPTSQAGIKNIRSKVPDLKRRRGLAPLRGAFDATAGIRWSFPAALNDAPANSCQTLPGWGGPTFDAGHRLRHKLVSTIDHQDVGNDKSGRGAAGWEQGEASDRIGTVDETKDAAPGTLVITHILWIAHEAFLMNVAVG